MSQLNYKIGAKSTKNEKEKGDRVIKTILSESVISPAIFAFGEWRGYTKGPFYV